MDWFSRTLTVKKRTLGKAKWIFWTFPVGFLIPLFFSNCNHNFLILYLRKHCASKNVLTCHYANDYFIVGQNNFGNKIPNSILIWGKEKKWFWVDTMKLKRHDTRMHLHFFEAFFCAMFSLLRTSNEDKHWFWSPLRALDNSWVR